jgi:hypothetical protein
MHEWIMIIFGFVFATLSSSIANDSLNYTNTLISVDSTGIIKPIDSNLITKDSIKTGYKEEIDFKKDNDNSCSCLIQSIIAILASLLTVLGSLGIFYWRIKRDRTKEIDRQKQIEKEKSEIFAKEQDKYWNYLLLVLDSIIENSKQQSEYCNVFSENSKVLKTEPDILQFAANYDLKRFLENTDQKELLIYFTKDSENKEERIKLFRDLYKKLDFLKAEIDNILETNKNFQSDLNSQRQNYALQLENFKDELFNQSKFIKDNASSLNDDDIAIAKLIDSTLSTFINEMIKLKETDIDRLKDLEKHHTLIVDKIFEELRDKFTNSRFVTGIAFKCKSLIYNYKRLNLTNSNMILAFENYAKSLLETSNELMEIKQKITAHNSRS